MSKERMEITFEYFKNGRKKKTIVRNNGRRITIKKAQLIVSGIPVASIKSTGDYHMKLTYIINPV